MSKLVALTFDDGHSNVTNSVLDILENNGVVGSFFLIGNNISEETKPILDRQLALGCEICNHGLTHTDMTTLTPDQMREEIRVTTDKIYELSGGRVTTKFFRPPFLGVNDSVYDTIELPLIFGADSRDWDGEVSVEERISNIRTLVRDSAIILMHDFTDNYKTLEALPTIIKMLRDDGYEFVTVSQMFEAKGIDPHVHGKTWSYVEN